MSAQIVMDAGAGPVIGSIELLASQVGTPVLMSNFNNTGVLGWKWEIVDAPELSPTLIPLPPATFLSTRTVTPDVKGHSILVRLTTYVDAARTIVDDLDQRVIGVRFDPPYDWVIPAAGQSIEVDTLRGWATKVNRKLRDIFASAMDHTTIDLPASEALNILAGQQMLYKGNPFFAGPVFIGTGGVLQDASPSAAELLQTLGQVLNLDDFLVGGSSPAVNRTPAQVRTILDVLTTAQITAKIQAEAPRDLVSESPTRTLDFTAIVATLHTVSGAPTITATLPSTGLTNGVLVGFQAVGNTEFTISGGGPSILMKGASFSSIKRQGAGFYLFRWSANQTAWLLDVDTLTAYFNAESGFGGFDAYYLVGTSSGAGQAGLAAISTDAGTTGFLVKEGGNFGFASVPSTESIIARRSSATLDAVALAANTFVGRAGSASIAGVSVGADAVVARVGSGSLGSLAIGSNSLPARSGLGALASLNVPANRMLGAPDFLGDSTLRALQADQVLAFLDQQGNPPEGVLTDGATIPWDVRAPISSVTGKSRHAQVTLAGNRILNITSAAAGNRGILRVIQDGIGTRLISTYQFNGVTADVKFSSGTAPTLTVTPGAQDLLEWYCNGPTVFVRVYALDVS